MPICKECGKEYDKKDRKYKVRGLCSDECEKIYMEKRIKELGHDPRGKPKAPIKTFDWSDKLNLLYAIIIISIIIIVIIVLTNTMG